MKCKLNLSLFIFINIHKKRFIMLSKKTCRWIHFCLRRALKTFAQTLAGVLTTCSMFDQIDWKIALSSSVIAGLASILTNIAGLTEIELEEKLNLNKN